VPQGKKSPEFGKVFWEGFPILGLMVRSPGGLRSVLWPHRSQVGGVGRGPPRLPNSFKLKIEGSKVVFGVARFR